MLKRIESLWHAGEVDDLDMHFARFMARLAGDTPEVALAACLASHANARGHVCVDLGELAGGPVLGGSLVAPDFDSWVKTLRDSPVVGLPGEVCPLILDPGGRLYLQRYWQHERSLADGLRSRAVDVEAVDEDRLRAGLARLFPESGQGGADWQLVAAATAVLRRLCVISGGPGTGKTTTLVRILALLVEQSPDDAPGIALAAPTGKAAARMQEAIRAARESLAVEPAVRDAIPERAATLHRLLGARPGTTRLRHDADNPLPVDVLVVDEASMIDLALMSRLVSAVPPSARLILLGDKDQLASVEAGAVLGDICGDAPGPSAAFQSRLEVLTGDAVLADPGRHAVLRDSVVMLRRSYRFGPDSGIARLAEAVNAGDAEQAAGVLEEGGYPDVLWRPMQGADALGRDFDDTVVNGFRSYLDRVRDGAGATEVLAAFNRFRLLAAVRRGPLGVEGLNAHTQDLLRERGLIADGGIWYPGRPVMVTENDYGLRLYNGDVGIALADPESEGRIRVCFESKDAGVRRYSPSRLPAHQTVFAMTVHKSQGSEADEVIMILPPEDSRVLTRELLYTAVTRARKRIEIHGSLSALRTGVSRRIHRASGLHEQLWVDDRKD